MKGKQLLILGSVLVVLVVICFVAKYAGKEVPGGLGEDVLVEEFDPGKVAAMEFFHGASPGRKVVLTKEDSKWIVPSKYDAPADAKRIDQVLDDLQGLGGEIRAREPSLFDQFEISEEQAIHLILRDGNDSTIAHLLIGKSGSDWSSSFARNAGANTVFMIDKPLLSRLGISRPKSGPLSGIDEMLWVDLSILPGFKWEEVSALELRSPHTELSFERVQDQKKEEKAKTAQDAPLWKVTTPGIEYPADDKGVRSLLQGLAMRRADDIADPAKESEYGFDKPSHIATFTLEDKSTVRILVGGKIEEEGRKQYYLKVEGERLPCVVASYIVDRLFEHAGKLLAMNVLDIPEGEIRSIAMQAPETEVVIEREGTGKWRVVQPALDFEQREGAAKQMSDKLRTLRPDDLFNRGDVAFPGESEYVLTLKLDDDKTRKVELSAEIEGADGARYVRVEGVEHLFGVSRHTFGQLCPPVTRLLNFILADVHRKNLRIMEITREKQTFTLRRDAEHQWLLDAYGFNYNADHTKVSDIRDSFTEIRPDDFIGRRDFAEYGLDKPVLTVRSKGRTEATVVVGRKDASGKKYYAGEVGTGIVFKMTEEEVNAGLVRLSQLATLRIFPAGMQPDSLALYVEGDKTSFTGELEEVEKDGKKFKTWVTQEDKELDAKLMRLLIARLQSLMAADILEDHPEIHEESENYILVDIGKDSYYLILHQLFEDEKEEVRYCTLDKEVDKEQPASIIFLVREKRLKPIYELAAKIEESLQAGKPEDKGK
jgi:hypothetical protein